MSSMSNVPRADDKIVYVSCYTTFEDLAHVPRGTPSDASLHTLLLDARTGELKHVDSLAGVHNPAFMRYHPVKHVLYAATECIDRPGDVEAFFVDTDNGKLTRGASQSANGPSTCYLTLSHDKKRLLFTNYWDGSIGAMPVDSRGSPLPVTTMLEAPVPVRAASRKEHLENRQSESHAHAIVLDPQYGRIAFVPDLGMDLVRQYLFDPETGMLTAMGQLPCAPAEGGPHGPRYIEFDPVSDAAYVVNELSSTVSIFSFDKDEAAKLLAPNASPSETLQLKQVVSTLPSPRPGVKNTCGRIAVDPSGNFVLVSNRGHDSIAAFAIVRDAYPANGCPTLRQIEVTGTGGATPRHFQFAPPYVIAANQDSDSLTVFRLDATTGKLEFTGHSYACNSPNFVCVPPTLPVPASYSMEF